MPCPFLREVVMLYCDAYPIKKMVPLEKLVTAGPCLAQEYTACPFYADTRCPPGCGGAAATPARKESLR